MEDKLISGLKEYVFAQYIGQKVLYWHRYHKPGTTGVINGTLLEASCGKSISYIEIRPLSAIVDDEAIYIAKKWGAYRGTDKQLAKIGKAFIEGFLEFNSHSGDFIIQLYQYLQQQGFALPIFYKGTHYTVEKLVKLNIIKL